MFTDSAHTQSFKQQRFKHIDSLRGIAALLVIWLHVSESFVQLGLSKSTLVYDISWYINTGRIGVVIFFAISGFVLLNSIKGAKSFLIKRFFRLYPAFWLSIIFGILVLQENIPTVSTIMANITMMPLMFDKGVIIGVYWTLESELIFYFIGLILFLFGLSRKPLTTFILSIFFIMFFAYLVLINFTSPKHTGLNVMPYHLSIMFWGGLFRHYYDNPYRKIIIYKTNISIRFLFILLSAILFLLPIASLLKGIYLSEFKSIQFGLANIIGLSLFLILTSFIKIKNKFMVWLGTISYSMYLFHPIVFSLALGFLNNYASHFLNQMSLGFYLFINVLLTILLSSFVYILIEKPSMKLALKIIH
jgi:peptidoglycan/LPS O-acetylase OafA/YrhL